MNYTPSEYWDYDYPDMAQPHHPAHPAYLQHHPAPVVAVVVVVVAAAVEEEGIAA